MMKSVNKVILLGNLTRDPELRYTEHSKAVCSFGLATNRNWITETGKKREEPEYHRLVAWEKLAEFCDKYLRKGRKVYVEGRLHTRSFTGKDGTERTATEIVVDDLVLLDPMPDTVREALDFQKPQ
jgi:single-strand DNA-binding protein